MKINGQFLRNRNFSRKTEYMIFAALHVTLIPTSLETTYGYLFEGLILLSLLLGKIIPKIDGHFLRTRIFCSHKLYEYLQRSWCIASDNLETKRCLIGAIISLRKKFCEPFSAINGQFFRNGNFSMKIRRASCSFDSYKFHAIA